MKRNRLGAFAPTLSTLSMVIGVIVCSHAIAQETQLSPIVVTDDALPEFGTSLEGKALDSAKFANSDTATLLSTVPGASFYTGGGVSSLPVLNGLGDDRLRITVDGMTITSACPNHMNPALSYIAPSSVNQLKVYAGIVPVSQGGDSIGGAIAVQSAPPVFAKSGEGFTTSGNFSAYHRSNGSVDGVNLQATAATENLSLTYTGNSVDADNYEDGNGKEVAASRYKVRNNNLKLAALTGTDLWTLAVGWQDIPFQGYPNQSMDMTSNKSLSVNAGYNGNFDWGTLEARAFRQHVRHKMDVLADKAAAAGFPVMDSYMPMDTDAVDLGYSVIGTAQLSETKTLRIGNELHRYTLDDWWPPLVGSGGMEPNTFWNVNGGKRTRFALFSELDSKLNDKLSTQIGARVEQVTMNTGDVQGYYDASAPFGDAYETDAKTFNAADHKLKDVNFDLTASARYISNSNETYDIGLSRKTRSPNIHERYTWANEAMMAGLMNNWFGDLNSYVGDLNLKPEVAYTLKTSADWHDAKQQNWEVTVTPFYTYVQDYINAAVNTSSNPYNMSGLLGRSSLKFVNQNAELYGVDMSGKKLLGKLYGEWTIVASLDYTRGKTTDGDNLYNIMPLNARLALDHKLGSWSTTFEQVFISAKDDVSAVRGEQTTAGYSISNIRTSYELNKTVNFTAGIDNLFNHFYELPLGGLEYATGNMINAAKPVRAIGRSINAGISINF